MATEGVIKFRAEHTEAPLDLDRRHPVVAELLDWRARLYEAGLVGQDPARYEGAGFGNVSARLDGPVFVVSGTQTGGLPVIGPQDLCVVTHAHPGENRVVSHGPLLPSSESMTHAALYAADRDIAFVFHVHAPEIWRRADALELPVTDPGVDYGTPAMVREVRALLADSDVRAGRVLVMGGHEDGVIAFGETADEAGEAVLSVQERSR